MMPSVQQGRMIQRQTGTGAPVLIHQPDVHPYFTHVQAMYALPSACHNSEWLIYVDGESQCVPPLYDTAYDDEYCIKVDMGPLAGRVVCACERGSTTVAMKDGMDTCVEIDVVRQVGYCGLNPCPGGYTCEELPVSGRFNCIKKTPKGEIVVPNWVSNAGVAFSNRGPAGLFAGRKK
ncbi:Hypp3937 [Branchiostoma lanceolatum]|uniref:Hypp3937 protein n=1 Tax=Branchiostoma lanceolatum TaxID=7740 RepID=A0A8K0EZ94_BRALA|nr:Hypp3937 [Branchiostoma lanceolatum]